MKKQFILFIVLMVMCLFPTGTKADESIGIDYISTYVEGPRINNSAYSNQYTSSEYTFFSEWYNVTDKKVMTSSDYFEKNKEYELNVKISALDGFSISPNVNVDFNKAKHTDFYVETATPQITDKSYQTVIKYNTTLEKYKIYNDIYLSDFNMKIGEKPVYNSNTYSHLNVLQEWYNVTDKKAMSTDDVFEKDKKYEFTITVKPKSKYRISKYISVNGDFYNNYIEDENEMVILTNTEKEYKVKYRYDTNQENGVIKDPLVIDLSGAKPGVKVFYINNSDDRYTLEQSWVESDVSGNGLKTLDENDFFQKGKYYKYNVRIIPKDGYVLSKSYKIDFSKTNNIGYFKGNWAYAYGDYGNIILNTNDKDITSINQLNTYEAFPHINSKYKYISQYGESNGEFTIESQTWYNVTNNKKMTDSDVFENGKIYQLNIKIKANDGYRFADEIYSDLDNFEESSFYSEEDSDYYLDDYTYEVTYVFKMQKQPNVVYGPVDLDVISPKIGARVSYLPEYEGLTFKETWYNATDDRELSSSDFFEANKVYEYAVQFDLKPGYSLASDFDMNYPTTKYFYGSGGGPNEKYLQFITSDDVNNDNLIFGSFHIPIKSPEIGKKLPMLNVQFQDYTYEQSWYNNGKQIDFNTAVENNKQYQYKLSIELTKKSFAEGLVVPELNSIEYTPYFKNVSYEINNNKMDVTIDYDINVPEEKIINEIVIDDIFTLKDGQKVYYSSVTDSRLDIKQEWMCNAVNSYLKSMNSSDNFVKDGTYVYTLEITPKDGYYLSPSFKAKINNAVIEYEYDYMAENTYYYEGIFIVSDIVKKAPNINISNEYFDSNDKTIYIPFGIDTTTINISSTPNNWHVDNLYWSPIDVDTDDNSIIVSGIDRLDIGSSYGINIITDETDEYNSSNNSISIYVVKAPTSNPTLKEFKGTYDGKLHTVEVNGGDGGEIVYSTDNKNWSSEIPTAAEIGTTTVYAKVVPDEYHFATPSVSAKIIIEKPKELIDNDIVISANDLTYNEKEQQLVSVNREDTVYYSLEKELNSTNYNEGSTAIPSVVNAGNYTVYYYIPSNETYKELLGNVSVIVKKVNTTPSVTDYIGIYDGNEHTITVNSEIQVEYSLDKSTWSDELPTRTEIGETIIYVRTKGNINYETSEIVQAKIIIRDPNSIQREDYNEDGIIDLLDVKQLFRIYMVTADRENEEFVSKHDINNDGIVDLLDVKQFFRLVMLGTYD